jgi:hypothetical protein
MAERGDLELQRGPAPEGSEKCGQKSGQEVSEGESKEKGQLPVYFLPMCLSERRHAREEHPIAGEPAGAPPRGEGRASAAECASRGCFVPVWSKYSSGAAIVPE